MSSWKCSKEGDLPLCILPKREILRKTISRHFVHQHSNSSWNFENDEIFPPFNGSKLIIWCIKFYYCPLWILCWLGNAFSLQNSIKFTLFKEKIYGRKWGSKRGRFLLLGGRWIFRREMRSKRGSLPPKEGDLTCIRTFSCTCILPMYSYLSHP